MSQQNKHVASLTKTLIYSSLFHFPLTLDELWRYLLSDKPISKIELKKLLQEQRTTIVQKEGDYYFLSGEEMSVSRRVHGEDYYAKKLAIAQRAATLLSFIPSIQFIGISGSLAAGGASKDADIDFFIITSPDTVWISRVLAILLLSMINVRRKRGVKKAPDKICLNSFIERSRADYFTSSQDLYTAHELAQLYPLLNRKKTYELLLAKNKWYLRFLPNAEPRKTEIITYSFPSWYDSLLRLLNPYCAFLQKMYMKKHQTTEIIREDLILLHPHDYKTEILIRFEGKLTEYVSLTKR